MSNNPPYAVVNLTKEQHEFLIANCDKNLAFGLSALQSLGDTSSRETLEKLVGVMEQFKGIKDALTKAEISG